MTIEFALLGMLRSWRINPPVGTCAADPIGPKNPLFKGSYD